MATNTILIIGIIISFIVLLIGVFIWWKLKKKKKSLIENAPEFNDYVNLKYHENMALNRSDSYSINERGLEHEEKRTEGTEVRDERAIIGKGELSPKAKDLYLKSTGESGNQKSLSLQSDIKFKRDKSNLKQDKRKSRYKI